MGFAVVQIIPLIGEQDAFAFTLAQLIREAPADMLVIVRVAIGHRRHFDEFGATEPQRILLFLDSECQE